jgi:DNA-binding PadR family transcriptional regulator
MKIPFFFGFINTLRTAAWIQAKAIIEERVSDFAKIKLPTIYYHLKKLKEQGFIIESIDRDGNRPEKTVYSITESGIKHFDEFIPGAVKGELCTGIFT